MSAERAVTEPHVRWQNGGEAAFVSLVKDAVVVRSTVSSPPGSRLEGTLAGNAAALVVRVKVHGCKKQPDGAFVIEGRLIDATREVRAIIAARAGAPAP